MSRKGKIYGLVGVIGSGKSYRAKMLENNSRKFETPIIIGDFSEGIRQTIVKILSGSDRKIDVNSTAYSSWKKMPQVLNLPIHPLGDIPYVIQTNGREILQRTGECLKTLAGEDVWARWTANYVIQQWVKMSEEDKNSCDIVFGSLRFECEVKALFKVAEITGKEIQIIFCDFYSNSYELNDHISEKFAQYFLSLGCKDGDDITQLVKEKVNE